MHPLSLSPEGRGPPQKLETTQAVGFFMGVGGWWCHLAPWSDPQMQEHGSVKGKIISATKEAEVRGGCRVNVCLCVQR